MKILHLIYDHIKNPWVGGGGAVRCYEINRRLAKKGHQITVICGKFPKAEDYIEEGVEFRFFGNDKNYILSTLSYAFEAKKSLKKIYQNFDIIVEDFAPWNPVFSYKIQNMKPVVLQIHHKEGVKILKRYNVFGIPFYFVENFYPKKFKNIISVSDETLNKFGVVGKVIPNGINEDLLKEKVYPGGKYCLYLGRIDFYNKGIDILLKAFEELDIKLKIVGTGKDKAKLEKIIKNRKNIEYLGKVNEKEKVEIIKNSRFLIMPSRYEGQGIVALESAALGKPVVVSDIPELGYVVQNRFGISFRSDDWKDLKDKVKALWSDEKTLEMLGSNGRKYAENYTWDKLAYVYEEYLHSICLKGG